MDKESGQTQLLLLIAIVLVVVLIGYNIYTGVKLCKIGIPFLGIETEWDCGNRDSPSDSSSIDISGRYSFDDDKTRIIDISSISENSYTITQYAGAWPWRGTVVLDGGQLIGDGMSIDTPATFKIDGTVLGDGSIEIDIRFITDSAGNPVGGRVDKHVLIPIN